MLKVIFILFAVAELLPPTALGQSTFGEITGVVKDPGQGLVGAAEVRLTSVAENNDHSVVTDADGVFHFVNLKPGHYRLVVQAAFGIVQAVQTAKNSGNRTGQLSPRLDF